MRSFEEISDRVIAGPVSDEERRFIAGLCDAPTEDFMWLVERLDADGCEFPKQQAALMLRNVPAIAKRLLDGEG